MGTYSFRKVRKYIRGEKAPLGSAFFTRGKYVVATHLAKAYLHV
jgi:hypothetical protein